MLVKLSADFRQHERQQVPGLYSKTQIRNGRAECLSLFIRIAVAAYQPSVQEAGRISGPQATQTHRNLLWHVYSRFFYLCTKVTVHVLRVAVIRLDLSFLLGMGFS